MQTAGPLVRCTVCDGTLAVKEPGNVGTEQDGLEHAVCNARQEAPSQPIIDMSDSPTACVDVQYNCGHYAYGSPSKLPDTCPECGDVAV